MGKRGPAANPELKRRLSVNVRFRQDELDRLDAERGRMPRAKFLRHVWEHKKPPPPAPEINREAWVYLARSAGNLTQIARKLNSGDQVTAEAIRAELQAFRAALLGMQPPTDDDEDDEA